MYKRNQRGPVTYPCDTPTDFSLWIYSYPEMLESLRVLIDFLLTVKAVTSIFISVRYLAISSAKQGKSGSIYNLVKNKYVVWAAQTCVHFMRILTVYTLNAHLLTLKVHNYKMYVFCRPLKYLKPHRQTVWTQIV